MAVWKSACQKLDIAREAWLSVPKLFPKMFGPAPKDYLDLTDPECGLDAESTWEDVADACSWPDSGVREGDVDDDLPGYEGVERWAIGLAAIYRLVKAVSDDRFQSTPQYNRGHIAKVLTEFGKVVCPSTQATPRRFLQAFEKEDPEVKALAIRFEDVAEGFKRARFAFKSGKEPEDLVPLDQVKVWGKGNRLWYGAVSGNVLVMRGASEFTNQGLLLTRSHVNLLYEALMRISNAYAYIATEYADDFGARADLCRILKETIDRAGTARPKVAPLVCRAHHKMRAYAQWLILRNLNSAAYPVEEADFHADRLDIILDLVPTAQAMAALPRHYRMDALHLYKWMPPPDYDATSAFGLLRSWHFHTRPSGADADAEPEMRQLFEQTCLERKMNLASAYHYQFRRWPPNLVVKGRTPRLAELEVWNPESLYPYYRLGKDITGQVKDKAIVAARWETEWRKPPSAKSDSFLLWYMRGADGADTRRDLDDMAAGVIGEDNYVRVAYKAEAHKPNSRLFFMGPPRRRIVLGEFEGNVSHIAQFYPGSLQGKSSAHKASMVRAAMDVRTDPPGVTAEGDYTVLVVTFDLSKFSPKSNYNVTANTHRFWANVYGVPAIEQLVEYGPKSEILHTTCGLKMRYRNEGADLEGFRGRTMTLFHADMLSCAARLARERGHLVSKGVLCVFIDDGVIKIAVPGSKEEAADHAAGFLKCMQDVYAANGQENNPTKTCLSTRGGEILADFYLDGIKQREGIKAAMRLAPDYENPATALTEDLDALFAASQGCVKDGGSWIATYRRYVEACLKAIQRWSRKVFSMVNEVGFALGLLTPKSYGGFGIQSLQGLVTTAVVNATQEGLGMLNRVSRMYPELRRKVSAIVSRPLVLRPPLSFLRDPTRVRASTTVMIENRLTMRVGAWLETEGGEFKGFLGAHRNVDLLAHATAVAEAMLSKGSVSVPLVARVWKSTPLSFVESVLGKFKRAGTIIELLGYRAVGEIRRKNSGDVGGVLRNLA
jgi:hypothetical protein